MCSSVPPSRLARPPLAATLPAARTALVAALLVAAALACARSPGAAETPTTDAETAAEDAAAADSDSGDWTTPAEEAGFRATPSYDATVAFLERLADASPYVHLTTFGTSAEGRPMPLVVVSREEAFTPAAAGRLSRDAGKPVVLIQNGVHSGEIDGKDACLMLLRDVVLGRADDVLDAATLLIVPIYNVDGHERVSPFNRANQNGPVDGMGFRTTADGLDLNRDHLKAVSPEARAVLALFNAWRPHLHVDDHVTDGSDHGWVLTWSWAEAPQIDPAVGRWLEAHMPAVTAATAADGHPNGPYISLLDRADPAQGISSWVGEPRYATGYYPLRNRPSILVEMHSYKPYRDRVLANHAFLVELLREIGRSGGELVAAVERAEADEVARGAVGAAPSEAVVNWQAADTPDRITVPFFEWFTEPSVAMGTPLLRYREGVPHPVEVDWLHRPRAAAAVARPRGYVVLPGWPAIEARLAAHGLRVERLTAPSRAAVEEIRIAEPTFSAQPYQGLHGVEAGRVERRALRRELPAGSLFVPADQPDFEVAVQLFEPEAADSLFSWGLLSTITEQKEYIEPRVLEPMVRKMLQDPQVRREWEAALAADPELAGDPRARWRWWYRRTPYWDDTIGLLPVLRLTERGDLATEAWPGPASRTAGTARRAAGEEG